MMKLVTTLCVALAVLGSSRSSAATVYDGVTHGTISTGSTYACNYPTPPACIPCVGGTPGYGPVISFGQGGFNGLSAWGTVSGTFHADAVLDGITLSGSLLPEGSYFHSVLGLRHSFCLGFGGDEPCPGYGCGVTYQIGGTTGNVYRTTASFSIDIPAAEAENGTFRFDICNHEVVWGTGCNVAGSINNRWLLVTPAPVVPAVLAAGDAPAREFPGTGVTVDKSSGTGGIVTATRVTGALPFSPSPPTPAYPDYWELRTDMVAGGFGAEVRLAYDPARLSQGTLEQYLRIWRMDHATRQWEMLPTTLDVSTHTAIATGLDRFSIFCLSDGVVVSSRQQSWGKLKTLYR